MASASPSMSLQKKRKRVSPSSTALEEFIPLASSKGYPHQSGATFSGGPKKWGPNRMTSKVTMSSKRKPSDSLRGSKGSPAVYGDYKLIPRIKELISKSKVYPDVDTLVDYLKTSDPEYRRRSKSAMKGAVIKALGIIDKELDREMASIKGTTNFERVDIFSSEDESDVEPEEEEAESHNLVNKSLTDLYGIKRHELAKKESKKEKRRTRKKVKDGSEDDADTAITRVLTKQIELRERFLVKPKVTYADLGGMERVISDINKLLLHIQHPELYKTLGIEPPRGFLLHGPPGVGKTMLVEALAHELDIPYLKCGSTELVTGISGESESKIRDLFSVAQSMEPCILFIDEIDAITPKRDQAAREMERRIVTQLLTCLDNLGTESKVVVVGATNRPDALDAALRRSGRFDKELSIGIPDEPGRLSILKVLCRNLKLSEGFDLSALAHKTPGYVGSDLKSLIREAAVNALERHLGIDRESNFVFDKALVNIEEVQEKLSIEMSDFDSALKQIQPSSKREGFATVPDVTWDDVGALSNMKEDLQMAILAPIRYQKDVKVLGLTTNVGILLVGPPGCGKTLLAKAIANESGINFISVKGPELLNMYVGESERAVRSVFARATDSKPCIIFFDEIDALCPKRSDCETSNATSRVVNQLLTEMDGMANRSCFLLAATNRPDILDPAILRPGRFDKVLFVGLPQPTDRQEILRTITKAGTRPPFDSDVNLLEIGSDCRLDGFTGADLHALVREASTAALKERIDGTLAEDQPMRVAARHFKHALTRVRPSISPEERRKYDKMSHNYVVRSE